MLDPSSEGSKSSTPTNDTKSKSRGAQVYPLFSYIALRSLVITTLSYLLFQIDCYLYYLFYVIIFLFHYFYFLRYVPRHRREADGKPQTTDDNVKKLDERDSIRDSDNRDTPLNNEPLKKNSEAKTTPIKEPHSSTPSTPSTPLTPSSPLTGTPPKPQIQVQSQTQTPKSKSKSTPTKPESETKNSSEKKTSKPKAKTVIVPLSLLDISDNTPQKEESIKPKCGPQKVTLSLTDVGPDGQSPATTPSKSTTNPPSAPTTPSSTTPKRAPPIHSISLVDNSVSPQILSRKEAPKVEKDASTNSVTIDNTNKNTSDNNGKEGEAESGSEEEWESNWEATLETWKSTTTTTTKPTEPASVRRTSSELGTKSEPAAVRGRGRKKFDDDGAEIGTSHPDLDGPSSGSSLSSNRDSSLSASSDSAITSVDRTDAQKQYFISFISFIVQRFGVMC